MNNMQSKIATNYAPVVLCLPLQKINCFSPDFCFCLKIADVYKDLKSKTFQKGSSSIINQAASIGALPSQTPLKKTFRNYFASFLNHENHVQKICWLIKNSYETKHLKAVGFFAKHKARLKERN